MESEIKNLNQQLLNFDLEPNYAHDDFFVSKLQRHQLVIGLPHILKGKKIQFF